MLKIEAIFKDKNQDELAFVTNQFVVPGTIAKVLFAFFDEKEKKWQMSWTKCQVQQLVKNEMHNLNERVGIKQVDKDLLDMVQKEVDRANNVEDQSLKMLKRIF